VILRELAPHNRRVLDRVSLEGPPISLRPRGVMTVGVAVHELCRQSVESGALSASGGLVSVRWQIEEMADGAVLQWAWIENGVPATAKPIDAMLVELCVDQAHGKASVEAQNDTRRVTLAMKLDAVGGRSDGAAG